MERDIKFGRHEKTHHKKSDERKIYERMEKNAEKFFDFVQAQKDCMKMDKQSFVVGFINAWSFLSPLSVGEVEKELQNVLDNAWVL